MGQRKELGFVPKVARVGYGWGDALRLQRAGVPAGAGGSEEAWQAQDSRVSPWEEHRGGSRPGAEFWCHGNRVTWDSSSPVLNPSPICSDTPARPREDRVKFWRQTRRPGRR